MSSKINSEFVDVSKIKPPGDLPKGMLSQFHSSLTGQFNVIEEMELMQATIPAEELNSGYTDIYNTASVVGGLVIAFCFSATQVRFAALDNDSNIITIWHHLTSMKGVEDVYGLVIGLALICSFISILYSMFMSTMLAQIPKEATNHFFELTGNGRIQAVFGLQTLTLFLFLLATLIQISVNYSTWVCIAILCTTVIFMIVVFIAQGSIQVVRIEVLRQVFAKKKRENKASLVVPKDEE